MVGPSFRRPCISPPARQGTGAYQKVRFSAQNLLNFHLFAQAISRDMNWEQHFKYLKIKNHDISNSKLTFCISYWFKVFTENKVTSRE